ncbi:hypothetical protein TSAR_004734 [Trichomalopsis sarcophagae]|uniref:Tyrosine-protein phosphatase domain-containing protein n=1 Tax=Trichomalopsis sarcophagae TaxID=543379 RepID=A0A232ED97_9HYME|nr:hypothetical protein TSAR_004734 [Trichomalopsis sarcophagae]
MLSVEDNDSHDEEYCSDDNSADYPKISEKLEVPKEWTYTMRRSMQEVVQGLFLGPYSAATKSKLDSLLEHGITHIVCVRQDIEAHFIKPNFPDKFKYLVLDIADNATENIIKHFKNVKSFIDEGLNSGGKVLVHGNAGISRSAALVIAYLMETFGLKQEKAYSILQQRRFCINPNDGFMAQLREYEPIYQAEKSLPNSQETLTNQRSKRTLHMTDGDQIDNRQDTMDSSLSD